MKTIQHDWGFGLTAAEGWFPFVAGVPMCHVSVGDSVEDKPTQPALPPVFPQWEQFMLLTPLLSSLAQ